MAKGPREQLSERITKAWTAWTGRYGIPRNGGIYNWGTAADKALDAIPDGWAKVDGEWWRVEKVQGLGGAVGVQLVPAEPTSPSPGTTHDADPAGSPIVQD